MENYTLDGATGVERTLDVGVPVVEQAVGGGSGDRVEAVNGLLGVIAEMGFSVPLLGLAFLVPGASACAGLVVPGALPKGLDFAVARILDQRTGLSVVPSKPLPSPPPPPPASHTSSSPPSTSATDWTDGAQPLIWRQPQCTLYCAVCALYSPSSSPSPVTGPRG